MAAKLLVMAHRGASAHAPENTIPAIEKAIEMKADAVELSVQATADDVPVCFHDLRLDRITGDTRRVKKLTGAQLAALDAGAWFGPQFKGTAIPTLADAFRAAGDAAVVLVLRELPAKSPFEAALKAAVEARSGRTLLAVADSDVIRRNKDWAHAEWVFLADERMDGWLVIDKSEKLGLRTIRTHKDRTDAKLVRDAHAKGMSVYVFYADEEVEMRSLIALGVDGILTNRPDRLRALVDA